MSKFKPWDADFKNVDPKIIRKVETELETIHGLLHEGESLTESESYPLRVEEKELVRALENLYQDQYPKFKGGRNYKGEDIGEYIEPDE